ncbi:beta-ketoacyl-ACP synthase II [Fictibacillus barbaricus]|uniref:3-oxoacyl-[acyl-carrier-protein] synthase 2 n=1 Tax=Fictibacillus barbaricus TaxID=182136 RepID=A0ABS2ZHA5_9BACL|nr:beta-ketoacyl-ACP synthase II [Fictibacillus barbaricus]MBN3546714.1 beta-ketoacyl-ACP synthase II [Fictibacillus barbaricus]GGB43280.1 3-oxoacyl-[acyl-carrier-protein] synthase 2 [Fictibacillus barbaricus]
MKRVVVTGMGAITPLGNSVNETWEAAKKGISGIGKLTRFDCTDFSAKTAAEVKNFNLSDYMYVNERHRMDRFTQYAVASSIMALRDSGILPGETYPQERIGVSFGTAIGGIGSFEETYKDLQAGGYQNLYPFSTTTVISNMASSQVSIALGAKGVNSCTVLSCASGSNAIGDAFRVIQRGEADVMIAGGSEASLTPLGIGAFCAMGAISTNPDPKSGCRPFDQNRDGLVMGEGAGALVLESLESALSRNATIYGEIAGYASVSDAYHITSPAPGGEGAVRAMEGALHDSGLSKDDISYINAHGTSTTYNDKFETQAIKSFLKERAYQVPISSTKSMTGHMMGAAGAIEAIFTLLTINTGIIPPTINLNTPDPECDLDFVPNVARKTSVRAALSNALGFGGHNTALIFKKAE